jgi:hypothetical protein
MTKFIAILSQIGQYCKERKHLSHYFDNIVRILCDVPTIDYQVISHDNKIVHSSDHHRVL